MTRSIELNGELLEISDNCTVQQLVEDQLGETVDQVAVAVEDEVIPRARWKEVVLDEGDRVDIVRPIQGGSNNENGSNSQGEQSMNSNQLEDALEIAGETFDSRLFVGTGGYRNLEKMRRAIESSGTEMVTVGLRRVNVEADQSAGLMDILKESNVKILPNTAGCYTAEDAVRTAELARESLGTSWIKLEVIGNEETLYPDVEELIRAARRLVEKDFIVLPYTSDDPVTAKKLEAVGCQAVMPLASPIGSGRGLANPDNLKIIREAIDLPLVVDAGIGCASDATRAMELGADAILVNSAIAHAEHPPRMASALKYAVRAGRESYLAGRIPSKLYAKASTTMEGRIRR